MRNEKRAGADVVCIGGAVVDTTYTAARPLVPGTSNPARGAEGFGGVARNVAVNLARLGAATALVSAVGADADGAALVTDLARHGVETSGVRRVAEARSARYVALLEPDGTLAMGIADMAVFDRLRVEDAAATLAPGPLFVFADCNCPGEVLGALLARLGPSPTRLAFDAVSTAKAARLPARLDGLDLLFVNRDEAAAVLGGRAETPEAAVTALKARGTAAVVLTLGAEGLCLGAAGEEPRRLPAAPVTIVDVTGAGDALIAGTLAGLLRGWPLARAARLGTAAAALTLTHAGSTAPSLGPALLDTIALDAMPLDMIAQGPDPA